jgi:hypothetical protein
MRKLVIAIAALACVSFAASVNPVVVGSAYAQAKQVKEAKGKKKFCGFDCCMARNANNGLYVGRLASFCRRVTGGRN